MSDQRIAIAFLAAVGMAGTFMPWVHIPILGYRLGTDYIGWLTLVLLLIPFVLAFLGNRKNLLKKTRLYAVIVASIIAAALGVWKMIDLDTTLVTVEYGLFLMVISGFAIPLAAFIFGDRKTSVSDHTTGSTSYDTEIMKGGAPD
jgi:apolipoprotein N-acyltransferase